MTEAWKSTPRFFCEVCRVWLNDNPSARATHERGAGHQENVAKKLRDMRKKADSDKKQEAMAVATMSSIEAKARQQYAKDMRESAKAKEDLTGAWEPDTASGHLYNARHRYYYDTTTRMYYGGEPPAWTVTPNIPPEAYYRAEKKPDTAAAPGKAAGNKTMRAGMRYTPHPMANIGGYQMPMVGAIGGAKGVGAAKQPAAAAIVPPKRKRDGDGKGGGKAVSKEEQEAQARREAARARVQARTMQAFGLR